MDLEEIKRQRLEALQKQQQEATEMQQQIGQLEAMVRSIFTKDALQRYGTLKMAHPDIAVKALIAIAQNVQSGALTTVDDKTLKRLLIQLQPKKRNITIKRR